MRIGFKSQKKKPADQKMTKVIKLDQNFFHFRYDFDTSCSTVSMKSFISFLVSNNRTYSCFYNKLRKYRFYYQYNILSCSLSHKRNNKKKKKKINSSFDRLV